VRSLKLVVVPLVVVVTVLVSLCAGPATAEARSIWFIRPLYRAPDNTLTNLGVTSQGRAGLVAATDIAAAQSGRLAWQINSLLTAYWIRPDSATHNCLSNFANDVGGLLRSCVSISTSGGRQAGSPAQQWDFYAVLGNGTAIKRPPQSSDTNRYQIRSIRDGLCLAINPASRYAVGVSALLMRCSASTVWRLHVNTVP
jgi:hypothetical protein